eukprot:bmy_08998T0
MVAWYVAAAVRGLECNRHQRIAVLSPGPGTCDQDCYGIRNQEKWFSLKTVSPQNTKAMNLLIAKARYVRKKDEGSNKQVSPDSAHMFAAGAAKKR